jgi:hypothetical protein
MRALLLTLLLVGSTLPSTLSAQTLESFDFKQGYYKLTTASKAQSALLRPGAKNLIVKHYASGPSVKYAWKDVSSYSLGLRKYIRASGFMAKSSSGWSQELLNESFVELLDSGAVSLMRYERLVATPQGGTAEMLHLLKRATEPNATTVSYSMLDGAGKKFRETLLPYLTSRPDLLAAVNDKKVTIYNLQTLIHALNNKVAFLNYPIQEQLSGSN